MEVLRILGRRRIRQCVTSDSSIEFPEWPTWNGKNWNPSYKKMRALDTDTLTSVNYDAACDQEFAQIENKPSDLAYT